MRSNPLSPGTGEISGLGGEIEEFVDETHFAWRRCKNPVASHEGLIVSLDHA
jgi:hypothetical protein